MPLLRRDTDWDALTDRLYDLAPKLEQTELVGLLDALRFTESGLRAPVDRAEQDALSRAVLARLVTVWKASRAPIALPALEAWLAVGRQLSPRPAPPAVGVTWAELLPACAPDLSARTSLERFADWLTLAELLLDYDFTVLERLGFPGESRRHCDAFLEALEQDFRRVRTPDIDQVARSLARMTRLFGSIAERADFARYQLESRGHADPEQAPPRPRTREMAAPSRAGHLDVARVLRDL